MADAVLEYESILRNVEKEIKETPQISTEVVEQTTSKQGLLLISPVDHP